MSASLLALGTAIVVLASQSQSSPILRPISPAVTENSPVVSDVSGSTGDVRRTVDRGGAVRSLEFGEQSDRPCRVYLRSYENQAFRDAIVEDSQCSNRIGTTQYWQVSVPNERLIDGIQACFNRRSGRLKGLRVFFDEEGLEGAASEIQPNCRGNRGRWAERVSCPDGYHLTGLRVHFRQEPRGQTNPIVGLQMICET